MAPRTNDFEVAETPSTYDLIITVLKKKCYAYKSISRRINCRTFEACKDSALKASALSRIVDSYGFHMDDDEIRRGDYFHHSYAEKAHPGILMVPDNELALHIKFEAVFRTMILCLDPAEVEYYRWNLPKERVGQEMFSLSEEEYEFQKARLRSQVNLKRQPRLARFAKKFVWAIPLTVAPQVQMPLPPAVPEQVPQPQLPQQQLPQQQLPQQQLPQQQQYDNLQASALTHIPMSQSGTQLPDQEENQLMAQVAGQEDLDLQYSDQDIEELMDFGQTDFSLPGQQSDQPLETFSQEEPLASELNGQQFSQPIDNTFEGALFFQLSDQQYGQPIDNTVSQEGALSFQLSGQPFNQPIDVLSSQLPSQQFSQPMENTDSQERPLSLQFPGQNFVQSPDQISVQETPVFQLPDQRTFQRRHYPYRQPQTNVSSQGIPKCLHRSSYRPLANLPDQGALQLPLQNYFQPVAQVFNQEAPASQISDQQLAELSLPGFHQTRLDLQQPSQSHPPLLSLPQITPQQQETQENASAQLELDQATIQVLELLFPPRKPTSSRGRLQLPVQPQNVQQDGSKMGRALMNIGQPAAQEQNILPEQPQQPQQEGQDTLGLDLALANYEQTEPQGLDIFFDEPKQSSQGIMLSIQEQDKEKLRLLRLRVAFLQNPEANPLPPSVAPELGRQKSARPRIGMQWQHNTFDEFLNLED